MAWSSDWCAVCHGAHCGEGPVLAILAMLAHQGALRVAPGGSAPPFPSVARRGLGGARSGRESRLADRTGKRDLRYRRLDQQVALRVEGDRGVRGPSMDDRHTPPGDRNVVGVNHEFLLGAD